MTFFVRLAMGRSYAIEQPSSGRSASLWEHTQIEGNSKDLRPPDHRFCRSYGKMVIELAR